MIPLSPANPAHFLAALGLMRVSGEDLRWSVYGAELEYPPDLGALVGAAQRCAAQLSALSTGGEVNADKWIAMATSHDCEAQEWCAAVATQAGAEMRPSQWRLVSGQQRWLGSLIRAAEAVTEPLLARWLRLGAQSYTDEWSMLGLDPDATRSAGYTASGPMSIGSPIAIWLAAEALRALPCVPRRDTESYTTGWIDFRRVRWATWTDYHGYDWARSVAQSGWLMMEMENGVSMSVDEKYQESDGGEITVEEALRRTGVTAVWQSMRSTHAYYHRLGTGVGLI